MSKLDREFFVNPYFSSIYYEPERAGLEQVAELEQDGLSYEFDMLVVWRDLESGDLFWASDMGCSCPTPFEAIRFLSELERIDPTQFDRFEEAAQSWADDTYRGSKVSFSSMRSFLHEVRLQLPDEEPA